MVISDFVVELTLGKAELRSATAMPGALFVMMHGELQMPVWPVDSSDFLQQVFAGIGTSLLPTFLYVATGHNQQAQHILWWSRHLHALCCWVPHLSVL